MRYCRTSCTYTYSTKESTLRHVVAISSNMYVTSSDISAELIASVVDSAVTPAEGATAIAAKIELGQHGIGRQRVRELGRARVADGIIFQNERRQHSVDRQHFGERARALVDVLDANLERSQNGVDRQRFGQLLRALSCETIYAQVGVVFYHDISSSDEIDKFE